MPFFKTLILAISIAAVNATPLPYTPSKVLPRDPLAPSTYPRDDACGDEWQYVNFDSTNAGDKSHLRTPHNLICCGEVWRLQIRHGRDLCLVAILRLKFDDRGYFS